MAQGGDSSGADMRAADVARMVFLQLDGPRVTVTMPDARSLFIAYADLFRRGLVLLYGDQESGEIDIDAALQRDKVDEVRKRLLVRAKVDTDVDLETVSPADGDGRCTMQHIVLDGEDPAKLSSHVLVITSALHRLLVSFSPKSV